MVLPGWLLLNLMDRNPLGVIGRWIQQFAQPLTNPSVPPVESQLLAYVGVALFGFFITNRLIPNIQVSVCEIIVIDMTSYWNNANALLAIYT